MKHPVPFGEWMPDAGILASTAHDIRGVFSYGGRYMPLRQPVRYSINARTVDRCLGHYAAKQSNGQVANFFGDRSRLYRLTDRVMVDVSRPGGYSADGDAAWKIDQFNNYVIASCRGAPVQILEMGGTSSFLDLGGGAGEADTGGRIGPHFVLAQGNEIRISAFNNPTDYAPAPDTQAAIAYVDQRGGLCHAIIGGTDVGAIFQERAISRMAYVGGVTAFDLQQVEANRGCLGPNAVAALGRLFFYASEDGFFIFDGAQSIPIGENKVDRYFADKLNYAYRNRVSCAIDTERKAFMVAFPSGNNPDITERLIYSIPDKRWTHEEYVGQLLLEMPREAVSLDDEVAVAALAGTTNLDAISISVDSPIWRETRKQWGAIDADRYLVLFEGATREAVLWTPTVEMAPGMIGYVSEVMPVTNAPMAGVSAQIAWHRHRLDEAAETSGAAAMNIYGACPVRATGRYLRAGVTIAAETEWSEAAGVHSDARAISGR
jgi:hypothetical protein